MKIYPFGAPDAIDVSGAVDRAGHAQHVAVFRLDVAELTCKERS